MIGKYERREALPSIEAAKKIADALEVSLDYLVGEDINSKLDKRNLKRLQELEHLEDDKKKTLYDLIDTYIRDAKARKAYAYKKLLKFSSSFFCYLFCHYTYLFGSINVSNSSTFLSFAFSLIIYPFSCLKRI